MKECKVGRAAIDVQSARRENRAALRYLISAELKKLGRTDAKGRQDGRQDGGSSWGSTARSKDGAREFENNRQQCGSAPSECFYRS